MMGAHEEIRKARDRGIEMTDEEIHLEDLREAFHKDRKNAETKAEFKAAQEAVRAQRRAEREAREAAGPPDDAVSVTWDLDGRAFGWNTASGDATAAPGGVA